MNNEYLKLIKNLVPIAWPPGFMGSFLGRFLIDDELMNSPPGIEKPFLGKNLEWHFNDRIATYLGFNLNEMDHAFSNYKQQLSKTYKGEQLHIALMFLLAKVTQSNYTNFKIYPRSGVDYRTLPDLTDDEVNELVNSEFDYTNFYYPYIKTHLGQNINFINSLEWKAKILCHFPPEKLWIPALLHLYKIHIHNARVVGYTENNEPIRETGVLSKLFKTISSNAVRWKQCYNYPIHPYLEDYHKVDLYDLIFNKNTLQLSTIEDKFLSPISQRRLDLLNLVQGHIEYICNDYFGIPTSYNLDISKDSMDSLLVEVYRKHLIEQDPKVLS